MTGRSEEQAAAEHLSHELRTPLTAVRLAIEDLINWPETPAAVGEQLRVCLRDVDRLNGAIIDVLAGSLGRA